jgi:hypothetical protein
MIAVEQKTTQTISYKIRERDHVKNLRKTNLENPPVLNRPPSLTHSQKVEEPTSLLQHLLTAAKWISLLKTGSSTT